MKLYLLTNLRTGQQYVGITGGAVQTRFLQHCYKAQRGKPGALYDALRECGPEAFSVDCIGEAHTRRQLYVTEMNEIRKRRTLVPNGYNITIGGPGVHKPRVMGHPERIQRSKAQRLRRKREREQ